MLTKLYTTVDRYVSRFSVTICNKILVFGKKKIRKIYKNGTWRQYFVNIMLYDYDFHHSILAIFFHIFINGRLPNLRNRTEFSWCVAASESGWRMLRRRYTFSANRLSRNDGQTGLWTSPKSKRTWLDGAQECVTPFTRGTTRNKSLGKKIITCTFDSRTVVHTCRAPVSRGISIVHDREQHNARDTYKCTTFYRILRTQKPKNLRP